MIIPLTYYLPLNNDKLDERFSWRMFSTTYHNHKTINLFVDNIKIINENQIGELVGKLWLYNLKIGSLQVLKSFLNFYCNHTNTSTPIRLELNVFQFDGINWMRILKKNCGIKNDIIKIQEKTINPKYLSNFDKKNINKKILIADKKMNIKKTLFKK